MDAYLDTFRIWDQESNIKEVHTSEPFTCNICSEVFDVPSMLWHFLDVKDKFEAEDSSQPPLSSLFNAQQQLPNTIETINASTSSNSSSTSNSSNIGSIESPHSDNECTGVQVEPPVEDETDDTRMVLGDVSGSEETGSTTEYVEILEDYTEPMFPDTNIEVETTNEESTITEAAHETTIKDDQKPIQQSQPQIYYIYNNSSSTKTTIKTEETISHTNKKQQENLVEEEDKAAADSKLFMCGVCKVILEKRYLANHMKKHLQQVNETHTCRICKDTFSRKMLLSVHISQKHSIFTKDYVCQICKLPYDENNNELHSGCHWFCNICSKTFMTKASMVCHSRMRHNRKYYKIFCSI